MGRNKSIDNFIEGMLNEVKSKVNVLKAQEANSTIRIKELEIKRNNLSKEIYDLGKKLESIKKESLIKADEIQKSAKEKMGKAIIRESLATAKENGFIQKQKEADDLIKSNEGLKKTLQKSITEAKDKMANLEKAGQVIKEIMGE